jgi:hypothetical protein
LLAACVALLTSLPHESKAGSIFAGLRERHSCDGPLCSDGTFTDKFAGTWYWLRSPTEEKRAVMGLYNRYCIRCHGVDGRGVWDIPDVPDFTNVR